MSTIVLSEADKGAKSALITVDYELGVLTRCSSDTYYEASVGLGTDTLDRSKASGFWVDGGHCPGEIKSRIAVNLVFDFLHV